jgi:uncharacterized protein (TIGR02466 family)
MEELNLFSTPIWKFKFQDHTLYKDKMMSYLNNPDVYKDNTRNSRLYFTGPNLDKLEEFSELKNFIHESLKQVMINLGCEPSIQFTGMWSTKHEDSGYHHRHSHSNSFLTGVYYLSGTNANSGTIFYNNNRYNRVIMPARLKGVSEKKMLSSHSNPFEEGTLVIFPAWLEHDTYINNINRTNSVRHIVSFNTMPLGMTNQDEFDRWSYPDGRDHPLVNKRTDLFNS